MDLSSEDAYTEKSAFLTSFGKVFCRPAVTSLKKHFLGLFCTWLLLDLFDSPSSCTGRESASSRLSLSPPDNLWCPMVPLSPSCSPYPRYFTFNLGWRDLTFSVIACRNCSLIQLFLVPCFDVFHFYDPLIFWDAGALLHPVFKVWVEHEIQCDTMAFLFPVPFPITLSTQTACLTMVRPWVGIFMNLSTLRWRTHTE